jgi:hypothetical protein
MAPVAPPAPVSKLDRRHTGRIGKRDNTQLEEGGEGGRGAEKYNRKNAWYSKNHSILSAASDLFKSSLSFLTVYGDWSPWSQADVDLVASVPVQDDAHVVDPNCHVQTGVLNLYIKAQQLIMLEDSNTRRGKKPVNSFKYAQA